MRINFAATFIETVPRFADRGAGGVTARGFFPALARLPAGARAGPLVVGA
mgnify:CR=1 FL=1